MNAQKPLHIYDLPVGVLPDVFEFVDLFGMLKYASVSTTAQQQIQYAAYNRLHLRLECRHTSRTILIKEVSTERSKMKNEFDDYVFSERKELKELKIVFAGKSAQESWHECGNGGDHSCYGHCTKTFLIMDNQLVPAIHDGIMEILYVYFENQNDGFKTLLRHLKATFQPYFHAADFRYISNNDIFEILAMVREEGLTINNFVRSLPERDPDLAAHVDELQDVMANTVIVSADPRGVERGRDFNWTYKYLLQMKKCESIILEESKIEQEELKQVVFSWMKEKYQLRLFRLLNPTDFDVPSLVDGIDAFPVVPEDIENG